MFARWLKIAPPMLLLALGYLLVISKSFLISEKTKEKVEADSVETNKMLGLSFQQQGMLDLALEKFRKIPLEEEGVKDLLYNLGLDFERKRQFSKALSTYNLIIADKKEFKDLTEIERRRGNHDLRIRWWQQPSWGYRRDYLLYGHQAYSRQISNLRGTWARRNGSCL